MWILKNSKELLDGLQSRSLASISSIQTFDFSTLYTKIPYSKLKAWLKDIIHSVFSSKSGTARYQYLVVNYNSSYFVKYHSDSKNKFTAIKIIQMLDFLIDNIFIEFGGEIYQQVVGIPMGTNCAHLLADLFLYSYKAEYIQALVKTNKRLVRHFNFTYRYIDDVLSLNNPKFSDYVEFIYPDELEIKNTTDSDNYASYLDLRLDFDNCHRLSVKLYDKRDDFDFPIVNFPFISSNFPVSPAYGVFVSQLIHYARACSFHSDFLSRSRHLSTKLQLQGYLRIKLIKSFKKFYGRHIDLIGKYNMSLSAIILDIFN
ncbi:hypothetical protein SNE40_002905 [Patella caerulea]|uniref:Reverse transcriptase domain-containing protein n=1 Tax=Patella caerulea TaxID=87958 RepID=A0AAN8QEM2_PATCE